MTFGAPPADIAPFAGVDAGLAPPAQAGSGSRAALPVGQGRLSGFATVAVHTIFFANGSARLGPRGRREVRRAYRAYREQGGVLRVIGHASSRTRDLDPMRHHLVNFKVSLDRANAVARQVIRLGARPEAVRVDAVSDSEPVYFEVMPAGEAGNRRTEVRIER